MDQILIERQEGNILAFSIRKIKFAKEFLFFFNFDFLTLLLAKCIPNLDIMFLLDVWYIIFEFVLIYLSIYYYYYFVSNIFLKYKEKGSCFSRFWCYRHCANCEFFLTKTTVLWAFVGQFRKRDINWIYFKWYSSRSSHTFAIWGGLHWPKLRVSFARNDLFWSSNKPWLWSRFQICFHLIT